MEKFRPKIGPEICHFGHRISKKCRHHEIMITLKILNHLKIVAEGGFPFELNCVAD